MTTETETRIVHSLSRATYASPSEAGEVCTPTFMQRSIINVKQIAPLIFCGLSTITFSLLLWAIIQTTSEYTSWMTFTWCLIGLSVPFLLMFRFMYMSIPIVRKLIVPVSDNTARICSVEVCINNETVLTVRSWWPVRMPNADVERHGIRVGMSSARRWLSENSVPGGKISRVKFSEQIAGGLCNDYICESSDHTSCQCSVCLDDIESGDCIRMKKCGHSFHSGCLVSWFSQSSRLVCPMCRADHHSLVPPTVIMEHTVKEEPSISVLSVAVEQGTLQHPTQ